MRGRCWKQLLIMFRKFPILLGMTIRCISAGFLRNNAGCRLRSSESRLKVIFHNESCAFWRALAPECGCVSKYISPARSAHPCCVSCPCVSCPCGRFPHGGGECFRCIFPGAGQKRFRGAFPGSRNMGARGIFAEKESLDNISFFTKIPVFSRSHFIFFLKYAVKSSLAFKARVHTYLCNRLIRTFQ